MGRKKGSKNKDVGGRPTDFKQEYIEQVYELAKNGKTDAQIAEFYKVTEQTINNWKNKHPKFFESLKKGKDAQDDLVEASLLKRALGYTGKKTIHAAHEGVISDIKEVDVEIPADIGAMVFWLKNRRPMKWRDRSEVLNLTEEDTQDLIERAEKLTAELKKKSE